MPVTGTNLIAGAESSSGSHTYFGFDPRSGEPLEPAFTEATEEEVARACEAAEWARVEVRRFDATKRAKFLDAIAEAIEGLGEELVVRADAETALGRPRIESERGRTCNQLRLFARELRDGRWVDARIDSADPERQPLPKPDLRRVLVPLGPVAVFGASNFPLAFSVAGGDTASALAAGCPVVAKGHPAHPGTSELVARAIVEAAAATGMPAGVFSLVQGERPAVSEALVRHRAIKAVAFTGSFRVGRILMDLAAARPDPVPVFAEMGSVNPVFLLEEALADRGTSLASTLVASVTQSSGQFCTKPGLIFGVDSPGWRAFVEAAAKEVESWAPTAMVSPTVCSSFTNAAERARAHAAAEVLAVSAEGPEGASAGQAVLLGARAADVIRDDELSEEIFGPAAIAVTCTDADEMAAAARSLGGQLTATIHGTDADLTAAGELIDALADLAGRLVFNGVPTGVEVGQATQHGGPWPATSDARFTSVGTAAIARFVRPVAFQNAPQSVLPPELRDDNPAGIWRLVDGELTR